MHNTLITSEGQNKYTMQMYFIKYNARIISHLLKKKKMILLYFKITPETLLYPKFYLMHEVNRSPKIRR